MALNTPYKRVDLNVNPNYAAMAQKDPWFAIGYALGEGYWNNYNERGTKKSIETGEQMLSEALKTGGSSDAGVLTDNDLISKYARPDKKQQILDAAIQLPELKYDSDGKEVKGSGNQQPAIDKGLLKWGYLSDKYADNPNPVSDSIAAEKLLNNTEIALSNTNMGAFDEAQFKLAFDKQLMADGRNARQREAAWAEIQPMIAAKKTEYNNQVSNQLFDAYKLAYADGNYGLAEQYAMQLNKFDPNLSKYLLTKERDRYQNELADQRADKAYMRQLGLINYKGEKGGKGNASIFDTEQYKAAVKRNEYYNKVLGERALTPQEEKDYYNVQRWLHNVNEQNYGAQEKTWNPDLNNKDDVMEIVKANQKGGKTNAEILAWAKKHYDAKGMSKDVYDSLVETLSPSKPKAKQQDDDKDANMFMGRDATKRSGIALGADDFELMKWLGGTADRVRPKDQKA